MTNLETLQAFQKLAVSNNLPAIQAMAALLDSGAATMGTDGNGNYWIILTQYNPDTGQPIIPPMPSQITFIPSQAMTLLKNAVSAMANLGNVIANATVGTLPIIG